MDSVEHIANHIRGYVKARGPCTFIEIIDAYDGDLTGEHTIHAAPNIILWEGVSKNFVIALNICRADWSVKVSPCSEMLYLLDGLMLDYDIVRQLPKTEYKKPRWLPVLISARRF